MNDIFRKGVSAVSEYKDNKVQELKSKAEELYILFDKYDNREMSIAKTNLEQAIMWAVKAIT